ncbi:MAG: HAD family phosphatase [Bacilli bacterium]|nr:HAD family phosphatase [Bacilli bacterium]
MIGNAFEFVASIIGLYKLTKINDIKGIIFDFNGTLFWDSEIQETAWKTFGQKLTGRKITDEEFGTYFHGRTNQDTLEYLTGKKLTKEEVGDLASQKETIYRDLCKKNKEKFVLAPGVIKYLDYLKQNKIPITIATASEINNLNFFIKNLNLDKWFDKNKIIYDDGTFKGKPEPDIYLKAAAKLDLNPNQCVVFEDATSGVISAKRAGVKTIIGIVPKGRKNPFTKETVTEIIEDFESKKIYSIFKEL